MTPQVQCDIMEDTVVFLSSVLSDEVNVPEEIKSIIEHDKHHFINGLKRTCVSKEAKKEDVERVVKLYFLINMCAQVYGIYLARITE